MKQLEYIQSSGTQYINTNINLSAGAEIISEFEFTNVGTTYYNPVYGTQNSASPWDSFYCRYHKQYKRLNFTGGTTDDNSISINTKYSTIQKISSNTNEFWLDGNKILDSTDSNTITTEPLYIFGMRNGGDTHTSFIKLYSLIIKNCIDGTILYYFIPAKDDNDVVCLYDRVSQSYFYNSGSGTFTAGPEVRKELLTNLDAILAEKQTNILPENIKSGVTVFGVTGNYTPSSGKPDIMLFDSMENMMNYHNADVGDYGTVYANTSANITATTEFSKCTCPNTVVLPSAFSGYANISFRSTGSGWFDCWGQLDSSSFYLSGYGEQGEVRIQYTSSDGITYTRTDGGSEEVDFDTTIRFSYPEEWNDAIGYFMQIGSTFFSGLYQYTANNLYEIAPTQLTATSNFVTNIDFLGKNGAEMGNLQNANITSLSELEEKLRVYDNLSVLGLDANITNLADGFRNNSRLTYIPSLDVGSVVNLSNCFARCSNLIEIRSINSSGAVDMNNMFADCYNLRNVPNLDTSQANKLGYLFANCHNLTAIPNFDTSNCDFVGGMFYGCSNVTTLPNIDTHLCKDMTYFCQYTSNVVSLPNWDFSNVTSLYEAFSCPNLVDCPEWDTSKVTQMYHAFKHFDNLNPQSMNNVINMCINSAVSSYKNLNPANGHSPLNYSNFPISALQARDADIRAKGWTY